MHTNAVAALRRRLLCACTPAWGGTMHELSGALKGADQDKPSDEPPLR